MNKKREKLLKSLRANTIGGREFCQRHSRLMDEHIKTIIQNTIPDDVAIIATGGYGREELCPYSDIDLLFLTPKNTTQDIDKAIEKFLYTIWDSGIKIGHAVRTIDECMRITNEDIKARTTLLDARLIHGDQALFETLKDALHKQRSAKNNQAYVKAKLTERDKRHQRLGDSRYVLEPNIKDGKGALRDVQTLFWIAQIIYDAATPAALKDLKIITKKEQQRFEKAYEFLLTVRCHLHDIAGRGEERLHFDIQPQIAERLHYQHRNNARAVERFMKHYFHVTRDIGDLTRILIAAMEDTQDQKAKLLPTSRKHYKGFEIFGNRLAFQEDQKLKDNPVNILRFFRVAQENDLDIHPSALQKISRNLSLIDTKLCADKDANRLFMDILTDTNHAETTLRRMNEAGVLERFIPEFRRIIALMQFDRYHVFTVDEHTLRAIGILHNIESGTLRDEAPLASVLIHDIENRRALYAAMLLHDICKGREKKKKGQDHSTLGAELALKLCPRLGLDDHETRLVSWLVFNHLFLSEIAFKRDIDDPKTLDSCLLRIHDPEKLKLLSILTTADIIAVGPDRWTNWKDKLLTALYTTINAHFSNDSKTAKAPTPNTPKDWDHTSTRIEITQNDDKNATIIEVFTKDKPALFSTLTGALAASGANIIEARIHSFDDGTAADIFTVQNLSAQPITKKHRHDEIRQNIEKAINTKTSFKTAIKKHQQNPKDKDLVFDVPTKITIDNDVSTDHTFIEIHARDRHALLYDISTTLTAHKLGISLARINTLGLKAEDIFYVKTKDGKKLTNKKIQDTLTKALSKVMENHD